MSTPRALRPLRLVAVLLTALVLGACSHAPRTAVEPMGPDAPPQHEAPAARPATRATPEEPATPEEHATPDEPATPGAPGGERGNASFYARSFEGRRTANGETYSGQALTAAHRTLPFGTRVRVTNLRNHRSVEVVINDRGPHHRGRVIDLSRRAAEEIDLVHAGVGPVRLEIVDLAVEDVR